jgi:CHASE1-domain containing sensor protein
MATRLESIGDGFMFSIDRIGPRAEALEIWRAAELLVSTRWDVFMKAESEARRFAFASYVAALDAEEAAANDLASLALRIAA